MSQQYPHGFTVCATCAYWAGEREPDTFGQRVTVESSMARGKCMCRGSGWTHTEKQACAHCSSYEKWPVLK